MWLTYESSINILLLGMKLIDVVCMYSDPKAIYVWQIRSIEYGFIGSREQMFFSGEGAWLFDYTGFTVNPANSLFTKRCYS